MSVRTGRILDRDGCGHEANVISTEANVISTEVERSASVRTGRILFDRMRRMRRIGRMPVARPSGLPTGGDGLRAASTNLGMEAKG